MRYFLILAALFIGFVAGTLIVLYSTDANAKLAGVVTTALFTVLLALWGSLFPIMLCSTLFQLSAIPHRNPATVVPLNEDMQDMASRQKKRSSPLNTPTKKLRTPMKATKKKARSSAHKTPSSPEQSSSDREEEEESSTSTARSALLAFFKGEENDVWW